MLAPVKPRIIRAPRGTTLSARSWMTEAPLRMLMNNLDPEVAENPAELVVYGGIGRAARDWNCYDRIVETLKRLTEDETLLVQSGKPVGVFPTHADAPRVLIANSNLVPHWATWEHFNELDRKGLAMYGQMTAGSWIYIGSQGIVQGTYETFAEMGRRHFGDQAGRQVDTDGGPRRHGRRAAAGGDHGGLQHAGGRMPPEPHRQAPRDRLRRRAGGDRWTRRSRCSRLRSAKRKPISVATARQHRRRARRAARARHPARCRDRSNLRARSGQRLSAAGLDRRAMGRAARERSQGHAPRPPCARMAKHVEYLLRFKAHGPAGIRLRQQHAAGGAGRGRRARLRYPGLRAGVHPPAVLPRHRAVPLGGAVGRPGGHLQDRRQGQGADPGRSAPASLARHGALADPVPGLAGAHLLGGPRTAASPGARVQRDGRERRAVGAHRHRPRSPGLRLGGEPEPRDRSHARRLGCGLRLAAAECAA